MTDTPKTVTDADIARLSVCIEDNTPWQTFEEFQKVLKDRQSLREQLAAAKRSLEELRVRMQATYNMMTNSVELDLTPNQFHAKEYYMACIAEQIAMIDKFFSRTPATKEGGQT